MRCQGRNHRRGWRILCASLAVPISFGAAAQTDAELDARREAFRDVYPAAERGEWQPVAKEQELLEDYVLWPDLKAAWLRAHLDTADGSEIDAFLERYGRLPPARELRYRYALQLAADEKWPEYLSIYRHHYQSLKIARLDCLAAHAGILSGRQDEIVEMAEDLWLVGRSQADECDPVFDYLRGAGLLDNGLLEKRFKLAVSAKQFSLARYLSRSMDAAYLDSANRWIDAGNNAEKFLQADALQDDQCSDSDTHREQLLFAIERVADSDAELASNYWADARSGHRFAPDQTAHISRHIALSAAQQHRADASRFLGELAEDAVDAKVRTWQVRTALLDHAWKIVIDLIGRMPQEERRAEEWRYWLAVALQQSGRSAEALPLFQKLAPNRSYFGFLAADEIDAEYAFSDARTREDESIVSELAKNPALIRARELYYVGLESRGRSEWNDTVSALEPAQMAQAAVLAHRWNWHSQAIATVAAVGEYDDLEMRYPLPYADEFRQYSSAANIRGSWAYGVARSESLFMADVRSHAGAIGLMQLMPETGRRTAAEIDLPYSGLTTLTDPVSNIRLGTTYLGRMLERFDYNVVLATAAYNAGPFKVEEWLPQSQRLDARIWIENIPYSETREFVRRVLVSDAIFHWRLTGRTRRLSAALEAIGPGRAPERLSSGGEKSAPAAD